MQTGTLVQKGWTYRKRSIRQVYSDIGIILSSPRIGYFEIEKLRKAKDVWQCEVKLEETHVVKVLWASGNISECAVCNLIEVENE